MAFVRVVVCASLIAAGCSVETGALSGAGDASPMDSASADGSPDVSAPDVSTPDVSTPDASLPDVSVPDASDTGPADSMPPPDTSVDTGCSDRDGDGVCDSADPCPDDPMDDRDGDGVCDSADVCPGSDDGVDVDGDGTPDGCDVCPIDGPSATPIPTTVTARGITISNVSLNGGGNIAIVDRGDAVSVGLDYEIVDCGCPGCIDQIEVGLVPGMSYQYCAYSAVPGCGGDTGSDSDTLRAPGGPGVYYVRFGRAQNFNCTHTNWWDGTPPAAQNIGALCVR